MSKESILVIIGIVVCLLLFIHFKFNLCFYNCDFDNIEIHKNIVENKIDRLSIFLSTTKSKAEEESLLRIAKHSEIPQVPFGLMNKKWKQFIKKIDLDNRNTKLYFFNTHEASWDALNGRRGFVIISRNRLVGIFITDMS